MLPNDTIAAVCTAPGQSGIGIIRVSGDSSLAIAQKIFKPKKSTLKLELQINEMLFGHIYSDTEAIDEVFCVYMKAPRSYTAEDVVEIHCHGGVVIVQKILSLLYVSGARPAEPGEFTKRAFLKGRIDLTQAEAVMSLIRAQSETALKQAIYQQQGLFSQKIRKIRNQLKEILVETEVVIDYPEEDIEDVTSEKIMVCLKNVQHDVVQLLAGAQTGKIIKDGLRTVIIGKPNVGKSSLLNALAGENLAIVTDTAGTTRDTIEEQVFFEGIPLVLIDTAGIRDTKDKLEQLGIERSREKLKQADMVLLLVDGSKPLAEEDMHLLEIVKDKPHILLVNKNDLGQQIQKGQLQTRFSLKQEDIIDISIINRSGWQQFSNRLKEKVYGESAALGEGIYVQEARHKALLEQAHKSLNDALLATVEHMPLDCILIDVKDAFNSMGLIIGETITDEILQEIFSRFCLGK